MEMNERCHSWSKWAMCVGGAVVVWLILCKTQNIEQELTWFSGEWQSINSLLQLLRNYGHNYIICANSSEMQYYYYYYYCNYMWEMHFTHHHKNRFPCTFAQISIWKLDLSWPEEDVLKVIRKLLCNNNNIIIRMIIIIISCTNRKREYN